MSQLIQPQINVIESFWNFFEVNKHKRKFIVYGGAGSGKSYAIAQHIVKLFMSKEDKVFLVVRNTLPALKITCFVLIKELLYDITQNTGIEFQINLSDLVIRHPDNGNIIYFKSLDDEEKIKSFETNYIWIEEATEITFEKYMQLNLRLRRPSETYNQMFISFNPISIHHWLNKKVVSCPSEDMAIHHSTWKNNPFLPREYIKQLATLAGEDENYYNIYTRGEWGNLGNLVYSNYSIEKPELWKFIPDNIFYGLDFGFNNETALIKILEHDKEYYLTELLYKSKMTNSDVIQELYSLVPINSYHIYADNAEPNRIQEILNAGFNCFPADKSVKDGIDFCKRHKLHVDANSINLIEEFQNYAYKKDKDDNVLEDPIKFHDHLMDAMRYGLYTNYMMTEGHKPSAGVVFY